MVPTKNLVGHQRLRLTIEVTVNHIIYLTVFLSRIFINKVLPITKAVANYDDYPFINKFYKAKSKLNRVSLAPKTNSMFIRIIAAIDS